MPLSKPEPIKTSHFWWQPVHNDQLFILERHKLGKDVYLFLLPREIDSYYAFLFVGYLIIKGPPFYWAPPFRIISKHLDYILAEANTRR